MMPNDNVASRPNASRLEVLDGWRAISILLVQATHMLPLGPARWELNSSAGPMGMALFFTLSGFLITQTLLKHGEVVPFLIRRFMRIVPLAWLATLIFLALEHAGVYHYAFTLGFLTNYFHDYQTPLTTVFWSLCVEVHFYLTIALVVAVFGIRGIFVLPLVGLAVTATRYATDDPRSIVTHLRVDEIMSGVALSLLWSGYGGPLGRRIVSGIRLVPWPCWLLGLALASHPSTGICQYFRPYFASALVGHTLYVTTSIHAILRHRVLRYIAEVSFAAYVIHPIYRFGWFADGSKMMIYLKRPLAIALTWILAHLSTRYFERPCMALGKRWAAPFMTTAKKPPTMSTAGHSAEPSSGELSQTTLPHG